MKMQFELTLINEWRQAWKLYSVWIFALVLAGPDIFNAAVSAGLISADHVPALFGRLVNIVGFVGIVSRIVKQKSSTIVGLPEDLQAKVSLGLITLEDANAEVADRAAHVAAAAAAKTAATAAQPDVATAPAASPPSVLVMSPVPALVQDAVDQVNAQAAAEATAATAAAPAVTVPADAPPPAPVAAPEPAPAPATSGLLADLLNATSTIEDIEAAVKQRINAEFTAAQQNDVVVRDRVMSRVIALTQEFTSKVQALMAVPGKL
jgi:hypothetical protein